MPKNCRYGLMPDSANTRAKKKLRKRLINTLKPNHKLQGDAVLFLANVACRGFAKIAIR